MLRRIIPCLDLDQGRVVKGVNFVDLKDCGDPFQLAAAYQQEGADELTLLDITAKDKAATVALVAKCAQNLTLPLLVGGGIGSLEEIEALLEAGARKVSLSSAAVRDPELIAAASSRFGAKKIVVAIDAKEVSPGQWQVFIAGGKKNTGLDAVAWAQDVAELGAGEILLTSMDRDGTNEGYDNRLNRLVKEATGLPLIASGGAGNLEHLLEGAKIAEGLLAASMFHFGHYTIAEAKEYLHQHQISVKL